MGSRSRAPRVLLAVPRAALSFRPSTVLRRSWKLQSPGRAGPPWLERPCAMPLPAVRPGPSLPSPASNTLFPASFYSHLLCLGDPGPPAPCLPPPPGCSHLLTQPQNTLLWFLLTPCQPVRPPVAPDSCCGPQPAQASAAVLPGLRPGLQCHLPEGCQQSGCQHEPPLSMARLAAKWGRREAPSEQTRLRPSRPIEGAPGHSRGSEGLSQTDPAQAGPVPWKTGYWVGVCTVLISSSLAPAVSWGPG